MPGKVLTVPRQRETARGDARRDSDLDLVVEYVPGHGGFAFVEFCVQALRMYDACMQYTVRRVPRTVDTTLRRRARAERRSLNAVALDALARGAGVGPATPQRDLSDVAGSWVEDAEFDRAIAAQHRIDRRLWR